MEITNKKERGLFVIDCKCDYDPEKPRGGTLIPSGEMIVQKGNTITIKPLLRAGFEIDEIKIDGAIKLKKDVYEFKNIKKDHKIRATFKKKK